MPKIDVTVTEEELERECGEIAKDIFEEEFLTPYGDDPNEDPEDYRDEMFERAYEDVDAHRWVIYTRYPLEMMLTCNTDMGEEFLEEHGPSGSTGLSGIATSIAFGEMLRRVENEIDRLIREYDPPEAVEEDEEEDA